MGSDSSGRTRHQRFEAVGRSASRKNARGTGLRGGNGEFSLRRPCQDKKARGRLPPAGQTACPLIFLWTPMSWLYSRDASELAKQAQAHASGGTPLADPHRAPQLSGAARVLCDGRPKRLSTGFRAQTAPARTFSPFAHGNLLPWTGASWKALGESKTDTAFPGGTLLSFPPHGLQIVDTCLSEDLQTNQEFGRLKVISPFSISPEDLDPSRARFPMEHEALSI